MPSAAVVITLSNRTSYTPDEELSFRHARHYLGRYDSYVLMPNSHQGTYPGLMPQRFPDRYFASARAFGSLLLSERFYRAFLAYDFVLIHHLDSIVLSDQLTEWCRAGYDYIGAPRPVSADVVGEGKHTVRSGGFSLRRVPSFLRVLTSRRYFVEPDTCRERHLEQTTGGWRRLLDTPRKYLQRLAPLNDVHGHIRRALRGHVSEDRFWSEYATQYDPEFRVAPVDVSLRFAFEAEPRDSFRRIGGEMPFGAHRWNTTDRAFYESSLLRHGLRSEVRLRPSREARAWGEFEIDIARVSRVGPR
jgi:hypothetical protein